MSHSAPRCVVLVQHRCRRHCNIELVYFLRVLLLIDFKWKWRYTKWPGYTTIVLFDYFYSAKKKHKFKLKSKTKSKKRMKMILDLAMVRLRVSAAERKKCQPL